MKQQPIFRNLLCLVLLEMSAQVDADVFDAEARIKALEKNMS